MTQDRAKKLRREQTNAERRLWNALRDRRLGRHKFRRQHPIGPYVVDFVCLEARLIIELDGEHHDAPEHQSRDAVRTAYLKSNGYRVVRFWNRDLDESVDSVLEKIFHSVRT